MNTDFGQTRCVVQGIKIANQCVFMDLSVLFRFKKTQNIKKSAVFYKMDPILCKSAAYFRGIFSGVLAFLIHPSWQ